MCDFYLYDDCPVLKNKLGIKDQNKLNDAEADFVVYRLRQLVVHPLKGVYDYRHLLRMHFFIFQDLYDWAGQQRKLNIYKEEPVLGGLSVEYADSLARLWKVHCFREGNTRTVITFCCQYADEKIGPINRKLFEKHSEYVRTALVAYNAVFEDLGDLSKKEYLLKIVEDAMQ